MKPHFEERIQIQYEIGCYKEEPLIQTFLGCHAHTTRFWQNCFSSDKQNKSVSITFFTIIALENVTFL